MPHAAAAAAAAASPLRGVVLVSGGGGGAAGGGGGTGGGMGGGFCAALAEALGGAHISLPKLMRQQVRAARDLAAATVLVHPRASPEKSHRLRLPSRTDGGRRR